MRPVKVSGQIFSDQSIIYPRFYSSENRSVMVLYEYNSNTILTKPLKKDTTPELVRAQMRLIQYLFGRGLKPYDLRIDNKCPEALKYFFRGNSVHFQFCPPNDHRTNLTEKAIDT